MTYILAEKYNSNFKPREVSSSLEIIYENLEYIDVTQGEYQIWEYPSGKIYAVQPDRKIDSDKDYYSPPSKDLWLPELVEIDTDDVRVKDAFDLLVSRKKSKKKPLSWLLHTFKLPKR